MQYPSSQNPKVTITIPGRPPRSADELPIEVDGKKIVVRPPHEPTIQAFHRSELAALTPDEYAELKPAIDEALVHNLIVDDLTPRYVLESQDKAHRASADKMLAAIRKRDTRKVADKAFKAFETTRMEFETSKRAEPNSAATYGLERKTNELRETWQKAETEAKEAAVPPSAE